MPEDHDLIPVRGRDAFFSRVACPMYGTDIAVLTCLDCPFKLGVIQDAVVMEKGHGPVVEHRMIQCGFRAGRRREG